MVLVSSTGVPSRKEVISRLYSLIFFIPPFKWNFAFDFDVASDGVTKVLYLSWRFFTLG